MNTRQAITTVWNSLQFATKQLMADRQHVPQEAAEKLYHTISTFLHDVGFREVYLGIGGNYQGVSLAGKPNEMGIQTELVDELCAFRGRVRDVCVKGEPCGVRNDVLKICDEIRVEVRLK